LETGTLRHRLPGALLVALLMTPLAIEGLAKRSDERLLMGLDLRDAAQRVCVSGRAPAGWSPSAFANVPLIELDKAQLSIAL
jgi:hypothetical protein